MRPAWIKFSIFLLAGLLAGTAQAQNVVADWNAIASATIVANAGKPPAESTVLFAYSSIAAYDAVNAIHGGFQPFFYKGKGAPGGLGGSCRHRCGPLRPGRLF